MCVPTATSRVVIQCVCAQSIAKNHGCGTPGGDTGLARSATPAFVEHDAQWLKPFYGLGWPCHSAHRNFWKCLSRSHFCTQTFEKILFSNGKFIFLWKRWCLFQMFIFKVRGGIFKSLGGPMKQFKCSWVVSSMFSVASKTQQLPCVLYKYSVYICIYLYLFIYLNLSIYLSIDPFFLPSFLPSAPASRSLLLLAPADSLFLCSYSFSVGSSDGTFDQIYSICCHLNGTSSRWRRSLVSFDDR